MSCRKTCLVASITLESKSENHVPWMQKTVGRSSRRCAILGTACCSRNDKAFACITFASTVLYSIVWSAVLASGGLCTTPCGHLRCLECGVS